MGRSDFPGGAKGKEFSCQCRRCKRHGLDPWVRKIPWSRKWQPAPVCLPGKFHGQRSLADYRPWGHNELDVTEHSMGVHQPLIKWPRLKRRLCCSHHVALSTSPALSGHQSLSAKWEQWSPFQLKYGFYELDKYINLHLFMPPSTPPFRWPPSFSLNNWILSPYTYQVLF